MADKAEGFWADAAVPGVGIRRVYVPPDELEERAAARGLVRAEVAAEVLGRPAGYVAHMVRSNVLGCHQWEGRDWIPRHDVRALLSRVGYPSDEERALEAAEARGEHWTAHAIRSRWQAEEHARMASMGYVPMEPVSSVSRDVEARPGLSLLAKFGLPAGRGK